MPYHITDIFVSAKIFIMAIKKVKNHSLTLDARDCPRPFFRVLPNIPRALFHR